MRRSRAFLLISVCVVIASGLLIVWLAPYLPTWVRAHFGDVLVCVAIYLAAAAIVPRIRPVPLAIGTFAFAVSVELTQLFRSPALDAFRATLAGQLTIGASFDPLDIVHYAIGTAMALAFDICVILRCHRASRDNRE